MPVLIEPMDAVPVAYSRVRMVDATRSLDATIMRVAKAVDIKHSLNNKNTDIFSVMEVSGDPFRNVKTSTVLVCAVAQECPKRSRQ